jgi:hypothetical protein
MGSLASKGIEKVGDKGIKNFEIDLLCLRLTELRSGAYALGQVRRTAKFFVISPIRSLALLGTVYGLFMS